MDQGTRPDDHNSRAEAAGETRSSRGVTSHPVTAVRTGVGRARTTVTAAANHDADARDG